MANAANTNPSTSPSLTAAAVAATPSLDESLSALSLAMPPLTVSASGIGAAGPFSPFHAADTASDGVVDANTFRDADSEVYRSLGPELGVDQPVFRSVGHMSGSAAGDEDMNSFAIPHHHVHSHGAAPAVTGLHSITANPFQPVSISAELNAAQAMGFGKQQKSVASSLSLNPKFDHTSASEAASDVLPPEVPGYLEPSYHFALSPSIRAYDFFGVLFPLLASARVDFAAPQLIADRACKVKCVSYGSGASAGTGRVPFVVSVFRLDKNGNRLVVEFQRRSGCVMHFSSLYRRVKTELQQKGVLLVAAANPSSGTVAAAVSRFTDVTVMPVPADLPPLENSHVSSAQAKKSIDLLLEMVGSEFTDVKMKAISMLSELTAEPVYGDALAGTDLKQNAGLQSVLKCLNHSNEDVQRSALTTLANLTQCSASSSSQSAGGKQRVELCRALLTTGHAAFSAVSNVVLGASASAGAGASGAGSGSGGSGSASSLQTVREAGRALANMIDTVSSPGGSSSSSVVATVKAVYESLAASNDAVTRTHADRIGRYIHASGGGVSSSNSKPLALPNELSLPSLSFVSSRS